jgi:ADP-heptose:LPS heptosyltransferase
MQHILVLRFSAMGDVALVLPVLKRLIQLNPDVNFSIATQPRFCFLFDGLDRCTSLPINLQKEYSGIGGLLRLKKHLSFKKFDFVIDLHDVLRTKFLKFLFKGQSKIITYDKGRNEKNKHLHQKSGPLLPHTTQRYLDAFAKIGLQTDNKFEYPCWQPNQIDRCVAAAFFDQQRSVRNIGLATLPTQKIVELLSIYKGRKGNRIFIFAGPEHQTIVQELLVQFADLVIDTNTLSLAAQLSLMTNLDQMIAVDSANMHFAALQGLPIVSLWGATTPEFGFGPLPSAAHQVIEYKNLGCRPCSVYGKKACSNQKCFVECLERLDFSTIEV